MQQLKLVSPGEHFKEKITNASKNLNLSISTDIEFYLVTLLCDFIKPSEELELDMPLAIRLKSAIESKAEDRTKKLKWLGDTSLYLAGFFQDFFNKKTYDVDYYITMGSSAYLNISEECDRNPKIYRDLSDKFSKLVEVVASVADDIPHKRDTNILATYDRWIKTKSPRLRKMLEQEGIRPIEVNVNKLQ